MEEHDWVGYVVWEGGDHDGFEEEIVVRASSKEEAARLVRARVTRGGYPESHRAKLVLMEPGRGTLDEDRARAVERGVCEVKQHALRLEALSGAKNDVKQR